MNATAKTTTAPDLLTAATEAEVSEALLRHALRRHPRAVLVEHTEAVPPIAPEHVTYRLGALEVEPVEGPLGLVAGAAQVSQKIDLWVPGISFETGAQSGAVRPAHALLGTVDGQERQSRLGDGTTAITGVYTVKVHPFVPLIEDRTETTVREALDQPHRLRKVAKLGPVEGTPEHRHQVIEYNIATMGGVRQALQELRGTLTAAGYITEAGERESWSDPIGDGSLATASPSRDRVITLAGVQLEWREV